ncbi:MAG TPA: 3-phosphoglycerate dehydrogenase family protein [Burkholderiales bacterium]|nr:3-phosphoglycerate dehydrogenase family protein [Burkholderiales bacterium]
MPDAGKFRILTLNSISPLGLKRFPEHRYLIGSDLTDPDAILVRSHEMHAMEIPASVRAIGRAGAGTNNIPVGEMSTRGVPVFNAPGANANAVKELVIAGMLMAARNIVPALGFVGALEGDDTALHERVEAGKKSFVGTELPQQTLGVLGLGKVGSLVADAAIKLGMDVLGYDPHITVEAAWSLPSQVRRAVSIDEVLKGGDYVTLHVPLGESTRGMIDAQRLQLMKNGAILLNFARDGLVDAAAVRAVLDDGRLRYYICDFPTSALTGHPRVVALPHLGASTREAEDNCAVMVVDQVRNFLEQGNIANAVNFPDALLEREAPYRVAIANANVPNMLGQISTAMARAGLNIHDMLNKSKGEMAYTLVDVDSDVPDDLLAELARIRGVLSVRYLPQS